MAEKEKKASTGLSGKWNVLDVPPAFSISQVLHIPRHRLKLFSKQRLRIPV